MGGSVDRELVIQGRAIRPEDIALIRTVLEGPAGSNRTRVSRELCAVWNWRNGVGRLKDMACRSLLLKLEARGYVRLPPRVTASRRYSVISRVMGVRGCQEIPRMARSKSCGRGQAERAISGSTKPWRAAPMKPAWPLPRLIQEHPRPRSLKRWRNIPMVR